MNNADDRPQSTRYNKPRSNITRPAGSTTQSPICMQILQDDLGNAQVLHLLGLLAVQRGQYAAAAERFLQSHRVGLTQPLFFSNLADGAACAGQADEAVACLRETIRLRPDQAKPHNDLGVLLARLCGWDQAADAFAMYCKSNPIMPPRTTTWATSSINKAARWKRSIALRGAASRSSRCASLRQSGQRADDARPNGRGHRAVSRGIAAAAGLRRWLLQPGDYVKSQQPEEAIACYREALRIRPGFVDAAFNLGSLLNRGASCPRLSSLALCREQKPQLAEVRCLLVAALRQSACLPERRTELEQSLLLKPDLPETHQAMGNWYSASPIRRGHRQLSSSRAPQTAIRGSLQRYGHCASRSKSGPKKPRKRIARLCTSTPTSPKSAAIWGSSNKTWDKPTTRSSASSRRPPCARSGRALTTASALRCKAAGCTNKPWPAFAKPYDASPTTPRPTTTWAACSKIRPKRRSPGLFRTSVANRRQQSSSPQRPGHAIAVGRKKRRVLANYERRWC